MDRFGEGQLMANMEEAQSSTNKELRAGQLLFGLLEDKSGLPDLKIKTRRTSILTEN